MREDRRGILPFTLTEIFVLLFFALALALAHETREREQAEAAAEENAELALAMERLGPGRAAVLAKLIQQSASELPEDFQELRRILQQEATRREAVTSLLVATGADSTFTDTASVEQLLDSLRSTIDQSRARYEALRTVAGLDPDNEDALTALADSISQLGRANRELAGQVAYFRDRVGNGLDHPPCWANADGEIEYAFEVTLYTAAVDVQAIWPPHRSDAAQDIPGMISAAGTAIGYDEFSRRVLPIFSWSTRQDPECRHFVVIQDSVAGGKEAFKDGLLTVERFFYKRLEN